MFLSNPASLRDGGWNSLGTSARKAYDFWAPVCCTECVAQYSALLTATSSSLPLAMLDASVPMKNLLVRRQSKSILYVSKFGGRDIAYL